MEKAGRSTRIPCFLVLLVVLACFSRFFLIGRESIWLDEAFTLRAAPRAVSIHLEHIIFFSAWAESHPALYHIILYFWTKLFGTGEAAGRSLSAVFGILLVISTYHVGRRLISREAGVIASLLLLVNPVAVYYSQEARMYTLIPLLMLLSTYYFYKLLSGEGRRHFILYVIFSELLMYADYLGALLLAVHALFLLLRFLAATEKRKLAGAVFAYPAILLFYIPWMPNAFIRLNWDLIAWMEPPTLYELKTVALNLLGIGFSYSHWNIGPSGILLGIWGGTILIIGMLVSLWEKKTFRTLVALLCLIPPIMVLISVVKVPIFNLRQASLYYPAMALTMATGFLAIGEAAQKRFKWISLRRGWLLLAAPLIFASLLSLFRVYTVDTKENWRAVASDMEELGAGRPIYICAWYMDQPFNYYYRGSADVAGIKAEDVPLLADSVDTDELILILSHIDPSNIVPVIEQDFRVYMEVPYRGVTAYFLEKKLSAM